MASDVKNGQTETPIVKRKLADEVFERLKAMISSGEYPPGESLPSERELMARFGVGRPAIREAMQALANLGLLTISHGERARVRELTARSAVNQIDTVAKLMLSASPQMLENLKDARRFFEGGMVREAATKATEADVVELERILKRQHEAKGDRAAFIQADMAFHTKIAAISGNAIFEAVSEAMLGWLQTYHDETLFWAGNTHHTLAEHDEILRCIKARDPAGAEAALTGHLDRSASLYAHRPA